MKKKIVALLLAGVVCFSLTACGDGDAQSVLDNADAEEVISISADAAADAAADVAADIAADTAADAAAESGEEGEDYEIPDAVINISPEEDKALTGILTEDSYTNEYFGYKLNRIENGTIDSFLDEGTGLMSLSESYANGWCGITVDTRGAEEGNSSVTMSVSALVSEEQGKTEQELVQERYDLEIKINESVEIEAECSVDTLRFAGEEHPALIERMEGENGPIIMAVTYVIKGDFLCDLAITSDPEKFDGLLELIEKI